MALMDGERQVAPTIDGIRRDHVARYEWALTRIPPGKTVLDAACGIGYGSELMARQGLLRVTGLDREVEAITYAGQHYAHPRTVYQVADLEAAPGLLPHDVAVCFETLEHLRDPAPFLLALREVTPRLIASVPNEEVFPHEGRVLFHHRHYTRGQFQALLARTGWEVKEWWGQEGPESEVEPDVNGRTLIAVAERCEIPDEEPVGPSIVEELGVPDHVAILGLGPSLEQYVDRVKRLGGKHAYCDEVWGINAVAGVIMCDRVFHMDDVRIQALRTKAEPESNIARMLEWMRVHPGPIYTSRPHPDYPGLVAYPLEAVLDRFQHDYFNSTAAYAVAYAIHLGVKKISLFGIDFTYPNAHDAEKGRGCVEFWLGVASARGIKLAIAKVSSLMDACHSRADRLYGYDTVDVAISYDANGRTKVEMTERTKWPTAEEIEGRYDHSRHPNSMVEAST